MMWLFKEQPFYLLNIFFLYAAPRWELVILFVVIKKYSMNSFKTLVGSLILSFMLLASCKDEDVVKGDQLFRQGKYEEAVEAYDDYLKLNPGHVKSIYNKARAYEELGRYDKAFATFQEVLDIDEKHTAALMSVGQHYYRANDYPNAAFFLGRAVEADDSNSQAFYLLGRSYHLQGMTKEAMEAYNNAISLNNNLGEAYLYRGALRIHLKRTASACSDFKMARSLGTPDAEEALAKYCN